MDVRCKVILCKVANVQKGTGGEAAKLATLSVPPGEGERLLIRQSWCQLELS